MATAKNAVFIGYNFKIVVQWGEDFSRWGGNEQIFGWWGETPPIRENPDY